MRIQWNLIILLPLLLPSLALGQPLRAGQEPPPVEGESIAGSNTKLENHIRLDLGMAAPSGMVGIRASGELWEGGMVLEPAVGLSIETGVIGSLLLWWPIMEIPQHRLPPVALGPQGWGWLGPYAGYGISYLTESAAEKKKAITPGTYHWADVGFGGQLGIGRFVFCFGLGASFLAASPELGKDTHDAFWFMPEVAIRSRIMFSGWSGIGMSF
jgi:hypothetical protein